MTIVLKKDAIAIRCSLLFQLKENSPRSLKRSERPRSGRSSFVLVQRELDSEGSSIVEANDR